MQPERISRRQQHCHGNLQREYSHELFVPTFRLIFHLSRTRKRTLRPARVYKGKPRNPCDSNNRILNITKKRLKRKTNELSTNGSALFDSVANTPFIQKRRKKNSNAMRGFDKNAGLVTSTPAPSKVLQDIQFPFVQKISGPNDSMRPSLDLSASKSTAKKLFTSTDTKLIVLANTIDTIDESREPNLEEINSFSQLIEASANAETDNDCELPFNTNPPSCQQDDSSESNVMHSSAAERSAANLLCDSENNQNLPNTQNASLSNALKQQTGRHTKAEHVNQRNIRFITSRTMSSTLESSANEDNANIPNLLVIKSGKWRRTLYEMRTKIMQCKCIHHHRTHSRYNIYTIYQTYLHLIRYSYFLV